MVFMVCGRCRDAGEDRVLLRTHSGIRRMRPKGIKARHQAESHCSDTLR